MRRSIIALCGFFLAAASVFGDPAADSIMKRSYALPTAQTMQSTVYMLLVDANGAQSMRVLSMSSRKQQEGTDSYTEVLSPPDVRGTKFLTLAEEGGDEVQRLWLPDLMRVRRIASSDMGSRFLGSDLSYYDMKQHRFGDFHYTTHGEEAVDVTRNGARRKVDCAVIDCVPASSSVPYAKVRMWVGKDDAFVYRSAMWNDASSAASATTPDKTVYILQTEMRDGIIIPIKTAVAAADGHKTLLQMNDVVLNKPMDPRLFTVASLER